MLRQRLYLIEGTRWESIGYSSPKESLNAAITPFTKRLVEKVLKTLPTRLKNKVKRQDLGMGTAGATGHGKSSEGERVHWSFTIQPIKGFLEFQVEANIKGFEKVYHTRNNANPKSILDQAAKELADL